MLRVNLRLALLALISALAAPAAFTQAVSFSTTLNKDFSSVHADFNSDGQEDFITGYGCTTNGFSLVLSNGNGTYAPPVCYSVPGSTVYAYAIGDFNGDGNTDVIVSNGTNTFYEFLGSASGKLHLQASFVTSTTVEGLVTADVNHDGKIDLLFNCYSCSSDTNLHVWFGNGDGGFTIGPSTSMSSTAIGYLSMGDFDGDGKADILAWSCFENGCTYQVLYGDGTGKFQVTAPFTDTVAYSAYDLNEDGKMDLVGVPYSSGVGYTTYSNHVKVLYGSASRTFTTGSITLKNCTDSGTPIAVSDFNGDGINDIAVVEAADCKGTKPETVNVLLGNADGSYQPEQVINAGTDSDTFYSPTVLRANQDAKPDVLFLDYDNADSEDLPAVLFENTSSGDFPTCSAPNHYTGITLCAPTSTVAAGSPVKFSIGAANQTAGRKVEVWIDGTKMSEELKHAFSYYSFLDASYSLSSGTHQVTVFSAGWDNLLEKISFSLTVGRNTCAPPTSPGLNVCSPINNSTDGSPVTAWASGTVTGTIARMEVWVDGVKDDSTYGVNTLKTNLSPGPGTHRFDYYIVNTAGTKWEQTVYAYVP